MFFHHRVGLTIPGSCLCHEFVIAFHSVKNTDTETHSRDPFSSKNDNHFIMLSMNSQASILAHTMQPEKIMGLWCAMNERGASIPRVVW